MNRWWIVGAGAVGIGLAVLMIPKADTGGDIPVLDVQVQTRTEAGERVDEGAMNRDPDAPAKNKVRPPSKSEIAAARARAEEEPNPLAERLSHLVITPEVKTASGLQAPWTDTRRKLAAAGGADAADLTGRINKLNSSMARFRRSPGSAEWSDFEAEQTQLLADIRGSRFHTSDVETSLQLVEERMAMLETHRAEEAAE